MMQNFPSLRIYYQAGEPSWHEDGDGFGLGVTWARLQTRKEALSAPTWPHPEGPGDFLTAVSCPELSSVEVVELGLCRGPTVTLLTSSSVAGPGDCFRPSSGPRWPSAMLTLRAQSLRAEHTQGLRWGLGMPHTHDTHSLLEGEEYVSRHTGDPEQGRQEASSQEKPLRGKR